MASRPFLLCLAMALAAPSLAFAQPAASKRDQARELAGEAFDLMRAGDLDAALAKLRQADQLVQVTTIRLEIAKLLDQQGKLTAAAEAYRLVIGTEILASAPDVHHQAREEAVERLRVVLAETPKLTVEVQGATGPTSLTIDGEPAHAGTALRLDPGRHTIVVQSGLEPIRRTVELARGDDEVERILVAATPPSSPSPSGDEPTTAWAPLGWSLLAVGTGGLITLGVAGGIGLARQADLKDRCGGTTCPAELQADVDRFEDAKLAATIGFVIGLSGTVLAVPPLVIAATESDDGEVALRLGPGSFSLQGRF